MLSAQQPLDAAAKPGPAWVAVASALLMLAPMPLALAVLATLLHSHGEGLFGSAVRVFVEGGAFGFAILFAALVATVASAAFSYLGVKRGTFPPTVGALAWAMVLLASFLGARSNLDAVLGALGAVAPADKATILAAAISELLSLQLLSSSLCVSACVCVALGQALAVLSGPHRGASLLGVLGFGALAVGMCGALLSAAGLRDGFRAVAMVSPSQKADLLFTLAVEVARFERLGAIGVGVAVALALVGGVVVARVDRRAGMLAAAALLVTTVGFRGISLLTERTLGSVGLDAVLVEPEPLLRFDGLAEPESYGWPLFVQGEPCADIARRVADHVDASPPGRNTFSVALQQHLTRENLECVFASAHARGYDTVWLSGTGTPREMPKDFPALLKPFFALFRDTTTFAPVKVTFDDEPRPADVATLIADGVELARVEQPVKTFTAPSTHPQVREAELVPARCEWKSDPRSLARGAAAAAANGSLLTIVVERPASEN